MEGSELDKVSMVRDLVTELIEGSKEQFSNRELKRVECNDFYVRMFLEDNGDDVQRAAETIVHSLRFRKERCLSDLVAADIPKDIFECGRWTFSKDINGKPYLLDRSSYHRRHGSMNDFIIGYISYLIDNFVSNVQGDLYYDVSGAGLQSTDIKLCLALIELYRTCYPNGIGAVYVYGVPRLVMPFICSMLKMVPKKYSKRVHFVSKEEAEARMGKRSSMATPIEASDIEVACQRRGLPAKEADNLKKYCVWLREACKGISD